MTKYYQMKSEYKKNCTVGSWAPAMSVADRYAESALLKHDVCA